MKDYDRTYTDIPEINLASFLKRQKARLVAEIKELKALSHEINSNASKNFISRLEG